ncbi:MAG TPA: portal protein [Kofleriaceae bacterium]
MADPAEAVAFLKEAEDAESENRQLGLTALKFSYGDQWPQYAVASRGLDRPQLTINETNTYIKRVTNAQRQRRPRGKASPIDNMADKKVAKVITGLGRHVEVNSDADNAYDTAFDFAARIGWGYWRLRHDYIAEDSRIQDIFIDVIDNPFTVYYDPNSKLPDGSDAERALITDMIRKDAFKKMYPGASEGGFSSRGTGDSDPNWNTNLEIRLAEYFYVERTRAKLVYLSNGMNVWEDQLERIAPMLAQGGITIQGDRDSFKRVVKWCKQTEGEILEEKTLPGRFIPVVPVYWTNVVIDSRRMRAGMVKDAMDPARMNNFWKTAITEYLALAPKAKWLIAEGQDEGHENEFRNANLSSTPVLRYKPTDVAGKPSPPPQRIQPDPPPAGFIEAAFMATQDLSRVMGVFDPAVRGGAQHKSDKTLNAEQGQSESTNFDGYDNLTRSIKHTWRIMLSWFPTVYDTQRVQRIIGEDGRDQLVTLNEKTQAQGPDGQAIEKVLNDVTVGTYDVVMDTGPGYDTLRKEGVAATMELMGTPVGEKVAAVADDLIVRNMDFPGADAIADRLAAANPMSQIDEKSEVPPQTQMQIKGLQQKVEQLTGALQAAHLEIKTRNSAIEIKEHGAILREKMKQEGDKEEREVTRRQKQHDSEVFALTAQNVAEINGLVKLLTSKTEHGHRLREMIVEFENSARQQDAELSAKSQQNEETTTTQ